MVPTNLLRQAFQMLRDARGWTLKRLALKDVPKSSWMAGTLLCCGMPLNNQKHNNTFQVTFDPLQTFAIAKARSASNAPERKR